jgi:hypothetical protein
VEEGEQFYQVAILAVAERWKKTVDKAEDGIGK